MAFRSPLGISVESEPMLFQGFQIALCNGRNRCNSHARRWYREPRSNEKHSCRRFWLIFLDISSYPARIWPTWIYRRNVQMETCSMSVSLMYEMLPHPSLYRSTAARRNIDQHVVSIIYSLNLFRISCDGYIGRDFRQKMRPYQCRRELYRRDGFQCPYGRCQCEWAEYGGFLRDM